MRLNVRSILPANPSVFNGFALVRYAAIPYMLVIFVRSCIHLFTADGGAQSIAGIDITVAGGENIIAIFHQWGAMQLLLIALLLVLFVRYPGFTPLILLTLLIEPILRDVAGMMMPVTSVGTPPGAALNGASFVVVLGLFLLSLLARGAPRAPQT
jgi:hypothetical protein